MTDTVDTCTDKACIRAKNEFAVIKDLLLVPLKQDEPKEELPEHRKWKGGCLPVLLPDLVPVNPNPELDSKGFFKVVDGKLKVTVRNQGNAAAGEFETLVMLTIDGLAGTEFYKISNLDAGKEASFCIAFESLPLYNCGKGSVCHLVIIVNHDFKVTESNVNNNMAHGLCSPQFQSEIQFQQQIEE